MQPAQDATKSTNQPGRAIPAPYDSAGLPMEPVTIGTTVVVKGKISGDEPLYIEGTIQGEITVPEHRVTIGRKAHVAADIRAKTVVIMGSVRGNVHGADLVEVRRDASVTGDISTQRIRIEEGATLKGSVAVQAIQGQAAADDPSSKDAQPRPVLVESHKTSAASEHAEAPKARAAAASSGDARPVVGSSVLLQPE